MMLKVSASKWTKLMVFRYFISYKMIQFSVKLRYCYSSRCCCFPRGERKKSLFWAVFVQRITMALSGKWSVSETKEQMVKLSLVLSSLFHQVKLDIEPIIGYFFLSKKVKYLLTIFNEHTHISSVGVDYNCGGNCHKNMRFFNKSCSLNQNEPGDAIETTRHSFFDNKKFWTWACDQLKPITGQRLTGWKHVTSMSCTLEPAIHSRDTGQRKPFLTAINWP